MHQGLNYFFFIFHTSLVIFILSGWIFAKTRKYHLAVAVLTAFSWFILGIWYGWGYCICTDWHWQIRSALGYTDSSDSYIHFLILKLTGVNFSYQLVNNITLYLFLTCGILSLILNIKDNIIHRAQKQIKQIKTDF